MPSEEAVPAVTTTWVLLWLVIPLTDTPHSVTLVTSIPSHKLVPEITTEYPPVQEPLAGATGLNISPAGLYV